MNFNSERLLDGVLRILDVFLALAGLCIVAPFCFVLMLIIKSDGAPALFCQKRIGARGKIFTIYKLRTMKPNAPAVLSHEIQDSFVTPLGHLLRLIKIDELPQLLNVFIGDMSLVGPRPGLASDLELAQLREENDILTVRPGITGFAQVLGVDMSDKELLVQLDKKWIKNRGLIVYLKILIKTLGFNIDLGDK
jgi:O-antigen biosynthesis protein WbqP